MWLAITYKGDENTNEPPDYNELHVYRQDGGRNCGTDQVYDLHSVDWHPDGWTLLTVGKDESTSSDYYNITSIDGLTCEVLDIWKWQPEGENPGKAIYLDDEQILLTEDGAIWNLSSRQRVESFTAAGEGRRQL